MQTRVSNLSKLDAYRLAVEFYRLCLGLRCPAYLKLQLERAASSVALNIAEGSAKPTAADQKRIYSIALGSLRECQAVLDLMAVTSGPMVATADRLGGCLYRITRG